MFTTQHFVCSKSQTKNAVILTLTLELKECIFKYFDNINDKICKFFDKMIKTKVFIIKLNDFEFLFQLCFIFNCVFMF